MLHNEKILVNEKYEVEQENLRSFFEDVEQTGPITFMVQDVDETYKEDFLKFKIIKFHKKGYIRDKCFDEYFEMFFNEIET